VFLALADREDKVCQFMRREAQMLSKHEVARLKRHIEDFEQCVRKDAMKGCYSLDYAEEVEERYDLAKQRLLDYIELCST